MSVVLDVDRATNTITTRGLSRTQGCELRAVVSRPELLDAASELLENIVHYLEQGPRRIRPGDTVACGCWTATATDVDGTLCLIAPVLTERGDASDFSTAAQLWKEQKDPCKAVGASFSPPKLGQLIVISDGVYEGLPVDGVRYRAPEHMTGWYLMTEKFTGDIETLRTEHAADVFANRPDLVRYLALPAGYRFRSIPGEVSFDQRVADEEPE
jgi:hypothetical protein